MNQWSWRYMEIFGDHFFEGCFGSLAWIIASLPHCSLLNLTPWILGSLQSSSYGYGRFRSQNGCFPSYSPSFYFDVIQVVVSNIYFIYFHPYLGKRSNLTSIFQTGWNNQLVSFWYNYMTQTSILYEFVIDNFYIFLIGFPRQLGLDIILKRTLQWCFTSHPQSGGEAVTRNAGAAGVRGRDSCGWHVLVVDMRWWHG